MNTKRLTDTALRGIDHLGFQLERLGVTDKINRHNLAAFLMAEQHHLAGEWDRLQTRLERLKAKIEKSDSPVLRPVRDHLKQRTDRSSDVSH